MVSRQQRFNVAGLIPGCRRGVAAGQHEDSSTMPCARRCRSALSSRARLAVAIPLLVAAFTVAHARLVTAADATSVVSELVSSAIGAINDKGLTEPDRERLFRSLLDQDFDMPRIAQFVVGPYWDKATDPERQIFIGLFEQWLVSAYSAPLDGYDGETIKVTGSRSGGPNTTIVSSIVMDRSGGASAKLDWVMHRDNDRFKVINVNIEGTSLLMVERAQIMAVIEHHGGRISDANSALQERLASSHPQQAGNY